jgi:hypothetical protein
MAYLSSLIYIYIYIYVNIYAMRMYEECSVIDRIYVLLIRLFSMHTFNIG